MIPFDEFHPYMGAEHIASILAYRVLGNIDGTSWRLGQPVPTGFKYVICDSDAEYNIARMIGIEDHNEHLVTKMQLFQMAIEKVCEIDANSSL